MTGQDRTMRRFLRQVLLLILLCAFLPAAVSVAGSAAPESQGEDTGLVIEVAGTYSIDEDIIIEEPEVPLAMPEDAGPRHAVMMGIVLLCVIGYTVYFDRYEKKLFELRREAAMAQKMAGKEIGCGSGSRI